MVYGMYVRGVMLSRSSGQDVTSSPYRKHRGHVDDEGPTMHTEHDLGMTNGCRDQGKHATQEMEARYGTGDTLLQLMQIPT